MSFCGGYKVFNLSYKGDDINLLDVCWFIIYVWFGKDDKFGIIFVYFMVIRDKDNIVLDFKIRMMGV